MYLHVHVAMAEREALHVRNVQRTRHMHMGTLHAREVVKVNYC